MPTEFPYNREVLVETLVYHSRKDITGCRCGWGKLGRPIRSTSPTCTNRWSRCGMPAMSEGHQRRRVYILLTLTLVLSAASVSTAAAATTDTIWPHTTTPAVAAWPDNGSVELGVKVTPAVDGTITGVSFYKGATNTGTHTGHLWGSTGAPLATATFTGETASGWQTALFPPR